VRENGGQYTHAAIWTAMAFCAPGNEANAPGSFRAAQSDPSRRDARPNRHYKVEPYVMAADVYAVAPHVGRGGWTWYTGSAGWMYRLLIETLLGVNLEGDRLRLAPRLPKSWPSFKIHLSLPRRRFITSPSPVSPPIRSARVCSPSMGRKSSEKPSPAGRPV